MPTKGRCSLSLYHVCRCQVPSSIPSSRESKLADLLSRDVVSKSELQRLAWRGCTPGMRPLCWQLLLDCLPLDKRSRPSCQVALRTDYWRLVDLHYARLVSNLQSKERSQDTLRLARVNTPLDVSLANEECVENQEVRDGLPPIILPRSFLLSDKSVWISTALGP